MEQVRRKGDTQEKRERRGEGRGGRRRGTGGVRTAKLPCPAALCTPCDGGLLRCPVSLAPRTRVCSRCPLPRLHAHGRARGPRATIHLLRFVVLGLDLGFCDRIPCGQWRLQASRSTVRDGSQQTMNPMRALEKSIGVGTNKKLTLRRHNGRAQRSAVRALHRPRTGHASTSSSAACAVRVHARSVHQHASAHGRRQRRGSEGGGK